MHHLNHRLFSKQIDSLHLKSFRIITNPQTWGKLGDSEVFLSEGLKYTNMHDKERGVWEG